MRQLCTTPALILVLTLFVQHSAAGQSAALTAVEGWSTFFAGEPIALHYRVNWPGEAARLSWAYQIEHRIIARGQQHVSAEKRPAVIEARTMLPPAKPGVVLSGTFSAAIAGDRADETLGQVERPFWIFPRDPFVDRQTWLESLSITLFDPVGDTASVFEEARIPYRRTNNLARISRLDEGILIVGEGLSLPEHPGLSDSVLSAAQRVPIVWLAIRRGKLRLPVREGERLQRLTLAREEIIHKFDKRLDDCPWPPHDKLGGSRLALAASGDRVMLQVSDNTLAFPWIEMQLGRHDETRGRLILCGFPLVADWRAGPTPRYLFQHLLERLALDSVGEY